jgi:hypothetical protein
MVFKTNGLTLAKRTMTMKKIITISLFLLLLAAMVNLAAPYFERAKVFASGVSIPNPGIFISEPIGLLILGVGIIGLARASRKIILKQK